MHNNPYTTKPEIKINTLWTNHHQTQSSFHNDGVMWKRFVIPLLRHLIHGRKFTTSTLKTHYFLYFHARK